LLEVKETGLTVFHPPDKTFSTFDAMVGMMFEVVFLAKA